MKSSVFDYAKAEPLWFWISIAAILVAALILYARYSSWRNTRETLNGIIVTQENNSIEIGNIKEDINKIKENLFRAQRNTYNNEKDKELTVYNVSNTNITITKVDKEEYEKYKNSNSISGLVNKALILFAKENYRNSKIIFEQILAESNSNDFFKGIAKSYLGSINLKFEIYTDETEEYLSEAIEILKKYDKDELPLITYEIANIYRDLGVFYKYKNKYETSLFNYNKALEIFQNLNERTSGEYDIEIGRTNQNIYSLKSKQLEGNKDVQNFSSYLHYALDYKRKAYKKENRYLEELLNSLNSAINHYKLIDFSKSLEYFEEFNDILSNVPADEMYLYEFIKAQVYSNMGFAYYEKYASTGYENISYKKAAEEYLLKGKSSFKKLTQLEKTRYNSDYSNVLHNLGLFYLKTNNPSKTIKHLTEAKLIRETLNQTNSGQISVDLAHTYLVLATYHLYQKENKVSLNYAEKALDLYETYGNNGYLEFKEECKRIIRYIST